MKDSQHDDSVCVQTGKYIKANNERFSTLGVVVCGVVKYIKANNERFSTIGNRM